MTIGLRTILSLAFLLPLFTAQAQAIKWPDPEVEQLYKSAQAYLSAGAYQKAIASYQQAIVRVPDQMILHRDLAQAFLLSGDPQRAEQIITPIIEKGEPDALCFVIAANTQLALNYEKSARKLLDKGIEKYPQSGFLYHERGKFYEEHGNMPEALQQWVNGTAAEPGYHLNYYEAARGYMQTTNNVWAIVYAEIFVNLERMTPRSGETRKLLLNAYRRFYTTPDVDKSVNKKNAATGPASFEEAVALTLLKLSPIVSDGVNTESLTMLRTRLSMEWMAAYGSKYPYALFQMYDDLLRAGHFDAYNVWLFGRAENIAQYDAWTKFHPEAMPEYQAWYAQHPLKPGTSDVYKHPVLKQIFPKSK